jgi:hypothetical protein
MFGSSVTTNGNFWLQSSAGNLGQPGAIPQHFSRRTTRRPGLTSLTLCLTTAFALAAPSAVATTVSNCNDSGAGSLRAVVGNAVNMDTVDLSQLNGCTITLTTGAIATQVNNLTLTAGNGAVNAVTIDGGFSAGHHNRVLEHTGSGTLTVEGLVITDSKYNSGPTFQGGCILSNGDVRLIASTVSHCTLFDTTNSGLSEALGGGVWALGNAYLLATTVTDNVTQALGTTGNHVAFGGGVYAGTVTAVYSIIANNSAVAASIQRASGGGIVTKGNIAISYSTISGNQSQIGGGVDGCCTATISNSTISGNTSSDDVLGSGGVYLRHATLILSNSTIAFNTANSPGAGGVYAQTVQLQSSIIADNTAAGVPSDLAAAGAATGANNLIFHSSVAVPAGTLVGVCPRLLPLADNGGAILTHALRDTSPAIDKGNNLAGWTYDERGQLFPRVFAGHTDIGAYEWQGGLADRVFNSGFEPGCDE